MTNDLAIKILMGDVLGTTEQTHEAVAMAVKALSALPSADAVEVVRCKDCKHQVKEWRTDKRLKNKGYMVCGCEVVGDSCGYWALLGQDDDYCSMAERRTDA